ncbi:RNA recognition domain-containing protein [Colletotrichum karsti]|uniref:RNA recognition domain-containing protein n=1 Tax=Colletotrichum karsti TaxID=1095194 RepID=A0A9P6HZR3_9PEZI|nr:RNA recognition domain-containing protein [Colletotrichum karsti]KAF9872186.1 RNA recognition domain-containing protein [Colletotrichum karsti]
MASPTEKEMLLERLQKMSLQHEREQASIAGSSSSQTAGSGQDHQTAPFGTSKSPDFSSVSSEDRDTERGGGARLDSSSLRGSPNSFARRSEAFGRSLRPTMSATATIRVPKASAQEEDDVFNDASADTEKPVAGPSSPYKLNQSHIQQANVKGKDRAHRNYVQRSPTKGRSNDNVVDNTDPQANWPSTACIFVANLPDNREDYTLEAAVIKEFERYGVVFVKIRRDKDGMPFAFVQFTTDDSADDARVNGRGSMILGRPCRTETVRANRTYIIFRKNRTAITFEEANELLSPFGSIETLRFLDNDIVVQLSLPITVRVQFKEFDPTQQVLRAFRQNKCYHVEAFDFKKAMQNRSRHPDRQFLDNYDRDRRSIFIGDLPLSISEDDIRVLMEDVGSVVAVQIKRLDYHRDGPRLIAFVEFTNVTIPEMAIERYHNNNIGGSIVRVERRTDRRRGGNNTPARIQGNGYNSRGANNMGGRAPSTPARERGPLAIEAGPSNYVAAHSPVRQTPLRNEMSATAIQNQQGMQHNVAQTPQNQGMQMQPAMPMHMPMQMQMPAGVPAYGQVPPQMGPQMVPQVPFQGPMQVPMPVPNMAQSPMGPPPPPQMGTPMMPSGYSPYIGTPFSQGPYSQGTGSHYGGYMTPQASPGAAPFWGYGHGGTPLWTPFPRDPSAYGAAYTSPAPARSTGGPAPVIAEGNQITQSEPVRGDNEGEHEN